jgi:hypothetical protein
VSKPIDPVVIRVWKGDDSDVFALFPVLPADNYGDLCTSYAHLGQHGGADYRLCMSKSRPATAAEAADLLGELRGIGYRPRVYHRATPAMHNTRRELARSDTYCHA